MSMDEMYVRFRNPVTGETKRVAKSSAMGRLILAGDPEAIRAACVEAQRQVEAMCRVVELRERGAGLRALADLGIVRMVSR